MSLHYFGTDGFRGAVNTVLTADHAYKIGRIAGWIYSKEGTQSCKVLVGRDTRRSSDMLFSALSAGLCASGANVYDLGTIPTPAVSHCVRELEFDCGIMITASHNPFTDNGIKLVNNNGFKMPDDVLEQIESYMDGHFEIGFAKGEHVGTVTYFEEGRQAYKAHLLRVAEGLNLKGMKVALDTACGAASEIAEEVFVATGAELAVIANDPDGLNINVDCGSTHIGNLATFVQENNFDLGFAFDGDCDRCIAVNGRGEEVNGDKILYICGKDLAAQGKLHDNMIVATVMSNIGFVKAVKEAGLGSVHTDVGDKFVSACMREHGYTLGGEQSGHVIFHDCEITGDGIVTALKVLHAVQNSHKSLNELSDELKEYPQLLVNVSVSDKETAMNNESVKAVIAQAEADLQGDGRILVRPSGTEPVVRVLVEASTDELCQQAADKVTNVLSSL